MKKSLLLLFIFGATTCFADELLRWEDSSGNLHYGTKPPAGAKNVGRVQEKSFSRYSTKKLFSGYGIGEKPTPPPVANPIIPENIPLIPENSVATPPAPIEPKVSKEKLTLSAETPVITRSADGKITNCNVSVVNTTQFGAHSIHVNFEFNDGALIPALGPLDLDPGASGQYSLPDSFLPYHSDKDPSVWTEALKR